MSMFAPWQVSTSSSTGPLKTPPERRFLLTAGCGATLGRDAAGWERCEPQEISADGAGFLGSVKKNADRTRCDDSARRRSQRPFAARQR